MKPLGPAPFLALLLAVGLSGCGTDELDPERSVSTPPSANTPSASAAPLERPVTAEVLHRHVSERARDRAAGPYVPPDTVLPTALATLDYDGYRSIRFRPEAALWHQEGRFEIQFFHRGFLFQSPVRLNVMEGDSVRPMDFRRDSFRYDATAAHVEEDVPAGLGYAGFRIHYPLNDPGSKDEVLVFLGASYFRMLASGHVHGLSGRGLAVDTASEAGEEFPDFVEFWLVRPDPEDSVLTFFGLLDGPSVSGAYRFDLAPGPRTHLHVEADLFARDEVGKLGVAPLTSMYLYGPGEVRRFDDFRPRVHDSDGLLAHTGAGEWIWRPLNNPPGLQVTSLRDQDPQGFGLMQRARDFGQYLDLEAHYHRRPSHWVSVEGGDWGGGGVELVEIPTVSEFNDNIVAYWAPDRPLEPGDERTFRYTVTALDTGEDLHDLARVGRTAQGWDALPGEVEPPSRQVRRFVVDFLGGPLEGAVEDSALSPVVEANAGEISEVAVRPLPDGEGHRVTFRLVPDGERVSDMRLFLRLDGERVTETWSYVWDPAATR